MRHLGPLVALATVAALAGCSGGADDNSSSPPASDSTDAGPTADSGPAHPPASDGGSDAHTVQDAHTPDAEAGPPPPPPPPPPPDIDTIPWQTGASIGYGVAMKDTQNPAGHNMFVGYSGYQITLDWAEAWVTALYRAALEARGVRYVWAVQGPNNPEYTNFEIGNSKIVATMLPLIVPDNKFVLVAGHSSGSFVAHELLGQLAGGLDPQNVTAGRVVYFDLDGGQSGLTEPIVTRLRRAYFVASLDGVTGTYSPNAPTMQSLGATYASAGGYWQNDASASGCDPGAEWCVHVSLINTHPHDPTTASPQADYSDFVGRPVCKSYIDAKAAEAGLTP